MLTGARQPSAHEFSVEATPGGHGSGLPTVQQRRERGLGGE
jgi:hypothetical protein